VGFLKPPVSIAGALSPPGESRVRGASGLCLLAFLAVLLPSTALAREIRVGVYENSPKVFTGEKGEPQGIFVDILEEVARREGWQVEFVPGTWQEGLNRLQNREIDLMPDVSYLEERDLIFDYNKVPALSDWFQVYRHRDEEMGSLLELEGKRVGVLSGSIQEKVFTGMTGAFGLDVPVVPYSDYEAMFRDLAAGSTSAAITNRFYGTANAGRFGVEETGVVFHPNSLFFAAPEGMNADLLAALDVHLEEMKKDPASAYFRTLRRWTGEEPELKFPAYLGWVLAALTSGMLLFFAASAILREQVKARTAELRQKASDLEKALAELKRAQAEAIERERLHTLGQMASGIAHDFNNILTPIIGYSELLVLRPEKIADREDVLKRLKIMHRAAHDGTKIVERMREFYKAREDGGERQPVDVNAILQEVIALARPRWEKQAQAANVQIGVETVFAKIPRVLSDPTEMREMFMNLLFNAVDAMPEGGRVTLSTEQGEGTVAVSMKDTGTGMTEEVRQNCLQPFFTTKGAKGTGIGLAMVNSTMSKFGGTLEIESAPGEGTTFLITFPEGGEGVPESVQEVAGPAMRSLSILAVDDDERSLESLTEALRSEGHIVVTAGSPKEAKEKFARGSFDVVFTDHAMPETSGVELAKEMRATRPGQPVVMISSFSESDEAAECSPECVSLVLKKPAGLAELRKVFTELDLS